METLNTKNLNEILRERYSNWGEDIDGKIKEDYERFMEFCKVVGIDPNNLKGTEQDHRYMFSEENEKFIIEVLEHFTDADVANLRKGNYSDVSRSTYEKIEKFITSVMKDCKASSEKINQQLRDFDYRIGYANARNQMKQNFEHEIVSFYRSILNVHWSSKMDEFIFAGAAINELNMSITHSFSKWLNVFDELQEYRLNELFTLAMEPSGSTRAMYEFLMDGKATLLKINHPAMAEKRQQVKELQKEAKLGNNKEIFKLEKEIVELAKQEEKNMKMPKEVKEEVEGSELKRKDSEAVLREILEKYNNN